MFYEVLAPIISQTITFYSCDTVGTILYYLLLKFYFEISETHMDSTQMSIILFSNF